MKQAKRLKRAQKEVLSNNGLNANQFMLVEEREFFLVVQNKETGILKNVSKFPARPIRR